MCFLSSVGLARTTTVCCAVRLAGSSHQACGVTRNARCHSTKVVQVPSLEYDPLANKQSSSSICGAHYWSTFAFSSEGIGGWGNRP